MKPGVKIAGGFGLALVVALAVAFAMTRFVPPQNINRTPLGAIARVSDDLSWRHTGGDAGQTRYSSIGQLTPQNVAHLDVAWTYHTGDMERHSGLMKETRAQATPIIAAGNLVSCTPFNRIFALDPATGRERWVFDPQIPIQRYEHEIKTGKGERFSFVCRGVAQWRDSRTPADAPCNTRIFAVTNDRRLIALDAVTGRLCPGFGQGGQITLQPGIPLEAEVEMQLAGPPAVVGDIVVVGSSMADNGRAHAPPGTVHAFDARTGALAWTFDPIPRVHDPIASPSWKGDSASRAGLANVWGSITVDEGRDLVFLPTSSPSTDFFGGLRQGANLYTDSLVAVRGRTGEIVWHFQTVHHDLWDFDIPAGPSLITLEKNGRDVDALVLATKPGFIFVLDRESGKPLFPVEERPVPRSDVIGEVAHPTQPFSVGMPRLLPESISPDDAYGVVGFDTRDCRRQISEARYEGLFTPPSVKGTLMYPIPAGVDWGGVTIDRRTNRMIVNTNRMGGVVRLVPRKDDSSPIDPGPNAAFFGQMSGTPYGVTFTLLQSPLGMPCTRPPWGTLAAVDLNSASKRWESVLGTTRDLAPFGISLRTGTPNFGGSIVTAGGLVFIGAAADNYLRAFDVDDGRELWAGRLPAGGQATPMTYAVGGRQYVVINAGGHSAMGTTIGDAFVAFALPAAHIK